MRRSRLGRKRPGHHLVICDLSGWKCWDDEVIETWDGLIVNKKFYEERHPQDFVRGGHDDQSVYPVRTESTDFYQCTPIYEDGVYDPNNQIFIKCVEYEL